jgi:glycosyltransferase involved in cell wall biosynthesis
MNKISAVISVYNEEKNIEKCLRSLAFVDEIVIIDNNSKDRTVELAKKFTNKIYSQKNNPSKIDIQKNFGFDKATGDWILSIDADEEVSPKLAEEIRKAIQSSAIGYYIPRKNIIFGKWIEHSGWYPDFQLRLFRRRKGRFTETHVHEPLSLDGKAGYLKNELIHHNYDTLNQFLQKAIYIYVPNEAQSLLDKGYVFSYTDAIRFPLNEFLSRFFLRKGYMDGFHGLILSMLMAFYHFLVFTNLWELNKFKDLDEKQTRKFVKSEFIKAKKEFSFWFSKERIDGIKNPLKKIIYKSFGKIL